MGKTFVIRALYANIITTVGLVLFKSIPPITKSEVLFVLYGGVILGVGIGIVVKFGGAIAGTEMLAIWFNQHHIYDCCGCLYIGTGHAFSGSFLYIDEND